MDQFCGGNWNMIATMATHSNPTTPSNQDHLYLQQQQQFHQQQQFPLLQQQQQQQQRYQISQQQQQTSQSVASHFHLQNSPKSYHFFNFIGYILFSLYYSQSHDILFCLKVTELSSHFEKCRQLLNTISGSIATKAAMVEGQKRKVDEAEQMLDQRRELIAKYRNSVEELAKSDL
uniref:Mediator of RNA polymerase II transcription subunit 9 n=1 Tax=Lactuca sativa TaxID=4236 RepID=A0A9R1VHW9_LACSA|nr:hypothetical protein LSAT_V11C500277410 [Lactuca sativa]